MVKVGGTYKHFKGCLYKVVCIAKHTETKEDMVIYHDIRSPDVVWARPLSMWEEVVMYNGKLVPRFKFKH